MNNYIATFYSQYGALSLRKELLSREIAAELISVPRQLSTSCGVCVTFKHDDWDCAKGAEDLEGVYLVIDDGRYEELLSC